MTRYNCGLCGRLGWDAATAGGQSLCFDCGSIVLPGKAMDRRLASFWWPREELEFVGPEYLWGLLDWSVIPRLLRGIDF